MTTPTILAIDTSGPHCGAAIMVDGKVAIALHDPMIKGQAERLFPMIDELMEMAGLSYENLDALGVGIGPGNFTGIRIAVSAARGLALSLGKKAVGVGLFDALALGASTNRPLLLSLMAAKDRIYLQRRHGSEIGDITMAKLDDLPQVRADTISIGASSPDIGECLGIAHHPAIFAPASAIARIAALRWNAITEPPAPLYIRPPDAVPSSDPPPVILPDDA